MPASSIKLHAEVFGKGDGCSKCAALKRRLAALLSETAYSGIDMVFHDVLTDSGMVAFLKAETLNPSRIPALLVSDAATGKLLSQTPEDPFAAACTGYRLGIQTDYSMGGGLITPEMIKGVLDRALDEIQPKQ